MPATGHRAPYCRRLHIRHTRLMKAVQQKHGEPLPELLKRLVTEEGQDGAARQLDISKHTLRYWMDKFDIRVARVAVPPGYQAVVASGASEEQSAPQSERPAHGDQPLPTPQMAGAGPSPDPRG